MNKTHPTHAPVVLQELKRFLKEFGGIADSIKNISLSLGCLAEELDEYADYPDFDRFPSECFGQYKSSEDLLLWCPNQGNPLCIARFESGREAEMEAMTLNARYFDGDDASLDQHV